MKQKIDSWYLGIDLGTGSCKSVVIDERGQMLGLGASEYPSEDVQSRWQEQNPEAVLSGMVASVRRALENSGDLPGECTGLSIGGALHSLMAVDSSGAPLTGIMTWADGRAVQEAKQIRQTPQAEALYQQTGCPIHGMYPLYKILWLKENRPEVYQRSARFLSAKEYVVYRLTHQYLVDYSLAAGSGLLDTRHLEWNRLALDMAGVQPEQLSTLATPRTIVNRLDPDLARQMGLSPSTRLILGSSDATNSNLGAGAVEQHQATCMIGTSGAFRAVTPRPVLDAHGRTWCYAIDADHWLVGGAINNGGLALSWLRDLLNNAGPSWVREQDLSFEALVELAAEAPLGAGGLVCLPFFAGERSPNWNLDSRGVFFGLSLEHGARHMARALLEGIAFRMLSVAQILSEIVGEFDTISASGGFTQSPFWLELMADALDHTLQVPAWGETSSMGAACWALLGSGVLSRLEDIPDIIGIKGSVQPNPANAQRYRHVYHLYQNLYQTVSPMYEKLAALKL